MFSTFPDGWPGAGLVLLRVTCGVLLVVQGIGYAFQQPDHHQLILWLLAIVAVGSGILLLVGYFTRLGAFIAGIACASGIFSRVPAPNFDLFTARLPCALVAVIAASVICLGPGAFSLDALLFGRREVVIPKNPAEYS